MPRLRADLAAPVIPPADWDRAAARVDQLTERERRAMLVRLLLAAEAHQRDGDDQALGHFARSVLATVHLRLDIPGYREAVDAPPARGDGPAVDIEDVLRRLGA